MLEATANARALSASHFVVLALNLTIAVPQFSWLQIDEENRPAASVFAVEIRAVGNHIQKNPEKPETDRPRAARRRRRFYPFLAML